MKTAVYIRVSTETQKTDMQRADLIRYCEFHGYKYDIFEEKVSGSVTNRPELRRMMGLIKECHYERVLVWKIDRFARSVRDLSNLLHELEMAKCSFVSFKEHLDLGTPTGKLMVSLLSVFAEFELATSKDRQRAGIAIARARGVKFGRPSKKILPLQIQLEFERLGSMKAVQKSLKIGRTKIYQILKHHRGNSDEEQKSDGDVRALRYCDHPSAGRGP